MGAIRGYPLDTATRDHPHKKVDLVPKMEQRQRLSGPRNFPGYNSRFMPITPEDKARQNIDRLLADSDWIIQDRKDANPSAGRGVAVREFPLKSGHGEADYLLYVDAMAAGVVEAKKEGETLTGVELQTKKYSEGVPDGIKDMKGDKVDIDSLRRTHPGIAAEYARASLKTGDLLLAIRGTYGRVADVPPELNGGSITQDTVRLDIAAAMHRDYVATCLRSPFVQTYLKRIARGVAVKGVNVADVRTCPIAVPPRNEQDTVVESLGVQTSTIDEVEVEVMLDLARSARLRQSVLKYAFEGKLVPQDPNDEPASVLLERIRAERAAAAANGNRQTIPTKRRAKRATAASR